MISLPAIRDELTLYSGPPDWHGTPTWILLDPARNRFFRLPWAAVEILARWHLRAPNAIADAVTAETTLTISPNEVMSVGQFLYENQLVIAVGEDDTARFSSQLAASRPSWAKWLLHHYLFFRIPIVKPDHFLSATANAVEWAFGKTFLWATFAAMVAGLFFASRQWDTFLSTFIDMFSWQGFAWYGVAYACVKAIHELGHAYAAKRYGCQIPTMGVAFLVMWPVLYTDTNEVWKLSDRRQRVNVAAAGVLAELVVAAWATLAWSILPDGPGRTVAFLLATTTWISSVAINLSPFMRFDGYFLLMDWLNMPNLHARSFAIARWKLRELLFDLGEKPPEFFSRGQTIFLVIFATATWAYRLLLFLGIALLVYHFFIKAVGVFLFIVEIGWFVLRPIWIEVHEWIKRRKVIAASRRKYVPLVFSVACLAVVVIPWDRSVTAQGVFLAGKYSLLYAPGPSYIKQLIAREQKLVDEGEALVRLESPELNYRLQQLENRISYLQIAVNTGSLVSKQAEQRDILVEELQGANAEWNGIRQNLDRHEIRAPFRGSVVDLNPDLHPGQWVADAEPLLAVRSDTIPRIEVFVGEDVVHRLDVGSSGRFFLDEAGARPIAFTVEDIDHTALRVLDMPYVATIFGGDVQVRSTGTGLVPEHATYRVRLAVGDDVPPPAVEFRGTAHLDASPESLLSAIWRSVAVVFLRESWG